MDWVMLERTDSTNRVAKALARQGARHGTAVLAKVQTAGRGRLGRSFFSPEGGLYLSVILRPGAPPGDLPLLTPMAAVAVCRAVEGLCAVSLDIKWVNDLYRKGKKLCGILCEGAGEAAVAGIGLNLRPPPGGFPADIPAVALDCPVDDRALAEAIVRELLAGCRDLSAGGFLTEYRRRNLALGKAVTIHPVDGEPWAAQALDIDDLGRLVVEAAGTIRVLDGGEVSLRL